MHFTWGDTVRVKVDAPEAARPGTLAEVVGIREVQNQDQSNQFWGVPLGTKVYLVEFGDGSAIEIPERMLEADGDERPRGPDRGKLTT